MKELKGFTFNDLLWFEKMVTPQLVTYLYWLGILGAFILGLIVMFSDFSFGSFILGILVFVFGVICSRVFYELVIILFKIYERLDLIAEIKTKEVTPHSIKAVAKPAKKAAVRTARKARTTAKKA